MVHRMKWSSRVFHTPVPDHRARDVYPLPLIEVEELVNKGVCRAVAKRVQRRAALARRANRAIVALNSIFYGGRSGPAPRTVGCLDVLPLNQRLAISDILKSVARLEGPPMHASGSEALKALRAASSTYYDSAAGVGDVVSMDLHLLSLPKERVAGVDIVESLDSPLKEIVVDFENKMLQDADVWTFHSSHAAELRPYDDPRLKSRPFYKDFVGQLFQSGIISFSSSPCSRVGAFTVSKKPKVVDGVTFKRQRLVLDCHLTNCLFRPSPHTDLGSLTALSEVYIPNGKQMYMSGADIKDCFYAVRVPPKLSDYFCLMTDLTSHEIFQITGGEFGEEGSLDLLSPCISVLPMGFSWSFFFVQAIHESSTIRGWNVGRDRIILDGFPAPSTLPVGGHHEQLVSDQHDLMTMPYCDNVHVIASQEEACNRSCKAVKEDLKQLGFSIHEEEDASTLFNTLGGTFDGAVGEVRTTSTRMWNLMLAFEHITRRVVSVDTLQRLLGHAMVICTINRYGMCIFRALYDRVQRGGHASHLNRREIQECLNFVGIVPLLVASLRRPWSETVTCTDASPVGYGICQAVFDIDTVDSIGRWQERWRFRRLPPSEWAPRRRAMGADVVGDVATVTGNAPFHDESDLYVHNESFPEVPSGLMNPHLWRTKKMGKWSNKAEHITLKEGRALVIAVRRIARASKNRGKRHLFLVDNLALALAINKGRAHSYALLRIAQQIASIALAGQLTIRVRWVYSEINVADGPSRGQIQPGSFKGLHPGKSSATCEKLDKQAVKEGDFEQEDSRRGWGLISQQNRESEEQSCQEHLGFLEGNPEASEVCATDQYQGGEGCWLSSTEESVDCARTTECVMRGPDSVQVASGEIQEFLRGRRNHMASRGQLRRGASRLHGHRISGGALSSAGGESSGSSGILADWNKGTAGQESSGLEGLEERDASWFSTSSPSHHSLWHGNDHAGQESALRSTQADHGSRHLPTTWRIHRSQEKGCGVCNRRGGKTVQLAFNHHPKLIGSETRQSRGVRQHSSIQFKRKRVHWGLSPQQSFKSESCRGLDVPFLSKRLQEGVHCSRFHAGVAQSPPISDSTWRSSRGFKRCRERIQLSESKRKVDVGQLSEKVHESRKDSTDACEVVIRSCGVLSVVTAKHEQGYERFDLPKTPLTELGWPDIMSFKALPKRFGLELFAGTARITSAFLAFNLLMFPIDICISSSHDFLNMNLEHTLLHWIKSGRITFVWAGMPCTSFSQARKNDGLGPGPLRDWWHLWGLDNLSRADRAKVFQGNQLLRVTIRILEACSVYEVPFALENPATSFAWSMPPMVSFIEKFQPQMITLDYCQFNEPWKKPTTIMGQFLDLQPLAKRCHSIKGVCSRTQRPHTVLAGRDSSGTFWTLRAQPYPVRFAQQVASLAAIALQLPAGI